MILSIKSSTKLLHRQVNEKKQRKTKKGLSRFEIQQAIENIPTKVQSIKSRIKLMNPIQNIVKKIQEECKTSGKE